jgi:hypothetical protein
MAKIIEFPFVLIFLKLKIYKLAYRAQESKYKAYNDCKLYTVNCKI